jgi:hypothetical protein
MTTTKGIEDVERCPFCGSNIEIPRLGRLGLTVDEIHIIAKHARDGTLKDVLTVAEIYTEKTGSREDKYRISSE